MSTSSERDGQQLDSFQREVIRLLESIALSAHVIAVVAAGAVIAVAVFVLMHLG
jgi:hypothetical protein